MGAIIKGIKIPKYTGEHKEFDRYGGFLTVYKNGKVELHIFDTDYTIESIYIPHGRLIDVDELFKAFNKAYQTNGYWTNFFALADEAPTVIEAEAE